MSKHFELLQRLAINPSFNLPDEDPTPLAPKPIKGIVYEKAAPDAEITKLVQRLFVSNVMERVPRVVSFSGIERDDRSSWICARAGETLAEQAGASVCIVDANLGSPQLHLQFAAPNREGLAEALSRSGAIHNFAVPVCGQNLWLISSGLADPCPRPSIERYRERFVELRETFDFVLASAPALNHEVDATTVAQLADGVVLIVEANRSRRETLRRTKEHFANTQTRLLGAILDQRTFPIPEFIYRNL